MLLQLTPSSSNFKITSCSLLVSVKLRPLEINDSAHNVAQRWLIIKFSSAASLTAGMDE